MSDYERERAVMEGEMIAAGEAYFAARPQMDMPNTRKAYDAGFQAGRDARRANSTCMWQQDSEGSDLWQTQCHQAFTINDGNPSDNSMAFCCFCGRRLEGSPWPGEDEAEEATR